MMFHHEHGERIAFEGKLHADGAQVVVHAHHPGKQRVFAHPYRLGEAAVKSIHHGDVPAGVLFREDEGNPLPHAEAQLEGPVRFFILQGHFAAREPRAHPLEVKQVFVENVFYACDFVLQRAGRAARLHGDLGFVGPQAFERLGVFRQRSRPHIVQDVIIGVFDGVLGVVDALGIGGEHHHGLGLRVHKGVLAAHAAARKAAAAHHPELVAVAVADVARIGGGDIYLLGGSLGHILLVHRCRCFYLR